MADVLFSPHAMHADEGLTRLIEGNRRFVAGQTTQAGDNVAQRLASLTAGQAPFAVVLGCSDSRVPAEIVFDQGLGDLFVIRVAGNIVAPSQIGSVEFAVEQFHTPLVVVLGHTRCGAIQATIDKLLASTSTASGSASRNINSIVERVRPSVETLMATELRHDHAALVYQAVRANVRASVNQLRHGSPLLEHAVQAGTVQVVGALYALETGVVEFFRTE